MLGRTTVKNIIKNKPKVGMKVKALNCTPYELAIKNIVKSEGCYLYDDTGKRYMDLESGVWCTAIGHNHPAVSRAIARQLGVISHVGYRYSCDVVEQAAEAVLDVLQLPKGKCVFLSSGSEAVEFAVQVAKRIQGEDKPYTLYIKNHFLSSYGQSAQRPHTDWIGIDVSLTNPQWEQEVEQLPFDQIGTVVFEPGNASGLVKCPPKERIATLASRVKENGGLLVVDEVTTGIGRTGKWFGFEHYGLSPDMVACGKGIGNGYPVSCIAMGDAIAERLLATGFRYAQSHQNDPLGCAVVLAVLDEIKKDNLIENAAQMGSYFAQQLRDLSGCIDNILQIRGVGLMIAVQLKPNVPIEHIHQCLLDHGYILGMNVPNAVLRIYPPLMITRQMIDAFIHDFIMVLVKSQMPKAQLSIT